MLASQPACHPRRILPRISRQTESDDPHFGTITYANNFGRITLQRFDFSPAMRNSMNPAREISGTNGNGGPHDLRGLCRWGGFAAFALLLYSLGTLVQVAVIGMGVPSDPAGIFVMLHDHKLEGLLRLDLPTILCIPFYYFVFLGLCAALRRVDLSNAVLSTSLAFVGTTLVLATPTALPMLRLSERYAAATSDALRAQYVAAGEAVMATNIWQNTGAVVGAVLLQIGAVIICWVMLRGGVFSKGTAWLGLVMHSLDLAHLLCGNFIPAAGMVLMALAGVAYPFWFFLIGRRLLQLSALKAAPNELSAPVR